MSSFCPDCGTPLKPEWKICTNCGKQLAQTAPTARQCIQCGTINQGDVAFCPNCGGQMVEFVQKPTGAKAANKKKRLVYGGVTAGIAFFTFLSFFLPYASNGFGMTISASKLMGTSFAEETFLLIAFLLSIVTLLCAAGAIFKRKLYIATIILPLFALFFHILPIGSLNGSPAFGFILHLLTSIATFIVSIVALKATKSKKR